MTRQNVKILVAFTRIGRGWMFRSGDRQILAHPDPGLHLRYDSVSADSYELQHY